MPSPKIKKIWTLWGRSKYENDAQFELIGTGARRWQMEAMRADYCESRNNRYNISSVIMKFAEGTDLQSAKTQAAVVAQYNNRKGAKGARYKERATPHGWGIFQRTPDGKFKFIAKHKTKADCERNMKPKMFAATMPCEVRRLNLSSRKQIKHLRDTYDRNKKLLAEQKRQRRLDSVNAFLDKILHRPRSAFAVAFGNVLDEEWFAATRCNYSPKKRERR